MFDSLGELESRAVHLGHELIHQGTPLGSVLHGVLDLAEDELADAVVFELVLFHPHA